MRTFYGPGLSTEHSNQLHDFLTARGWDSEYPDDEDTGYPEPDPDARWFYPESFGGVAMHEIDDITPYQLRCSFGFRDGGQSIDVGTAGNYQGCAEHAETEHEIPLVDDQLNLDRVAALLDDLEPRARALDPRALIECRFFGPCGLNNRR